MRRGSFEVVGVGWLAGAVMVARVVIASSSARLYRGGSSGEEQCPDGEELHCGLEGEGWYLVVLC